MSRRFQLSVLTVGAAVSLLPFADHLLDVPEGELAVELTNGAVSALLLSSRTSA